MAGLHGEVPINVLKYILEYTGTMVLLYEQKLISRPQLQFRDMTDIFLFLGMDWVELY